MSDATVDKQLLGGRSHCIRQLVLNTRRRNEVPDTKQPVETEGRNVLGTLPVPSDDRAMLSGFCSNRGGL